LVNKIYSFIGYHNDKKKDYHWMAKVERAKAAIAAAKSQGRVSYFKSERIILQVH
jgi:hypothetical protein